MSLLRRSAASSMQDVLARAGRRRESGPATISQAMRQSVIWASVNLRANLVSVMPADVFRKVGKANVEVKPPPFFDAPSTFADGHPTSFGDWMYAGQVGLDTYGNNVGIITATNALGLPAQIDLVKPEELSMRVKGRRIVQYRVNGEKVDARFVWHERQNLIPGVPVGLSPIAYMALTLGGLESAQRYAADWFDGGAVPSAILKNETKILDRVEAEKAKQSFLDSVRAGQPWTSGKDWTYTPIAAKASESAFIEMMQLSSLELVRYLGVPADMVDVKSDAGGSITYANITQRNLQLMTINLGPAVKRREDALTAVTPKPQFVKLNRSAVLAMDDLLRVQVMKARIDGRFLTPDEARGYDNLEPLTEADYAQFDRLFGAKNQNPTPKGLPA